MGVHRIRKDGHDKASLKASVELATEFLNHAVELLLIPAKSVGGGFILFWGGFRGAGSRGRCTRAGEAKKAANSNHYRQS